MFNRHKAATAIDEESHQEGRFWDGIFMSLSSTSGGAANAVVLSCVGKVLLILKTRERLECVMRIEGTFA